jgi:hypothetical protein
MAAFSGFEVEAVGTPGGKAVTLRLRRDGQSHTTGYVMTATEARRLGEMLNRAANVAVWTPSERREHGQD